MKNEAGTTETPKATKKRDSVIWALLEVDAEKGTYELVASAATDKKLAESLQAVPGGGPVVTVRGDWGSTTKVTIKRR